MVRGGVAEGDRPDAARARDLRPHRPGAARARAALRRHRRDRRLSDRDQRHLADRHPRDQEFRRPGHRGADLGQDRGQAAVTLATLPAGERSARYAAGVAHACEPPHPAFPSRSRIYPFGRLQLSNRVNPSSMAETGACRAASRSRTHLHLFTCQTARSFRCRFHATKHKAPPARSRSCAGKHVNPFPFSASRPSERGDGAPRRRNISGCLAASRTPFEACRTLSGECSPLGAPSRRCFPSRAARLGVHVRLAPTRACERIANRS